MSWSICLSFLLAAYTASRPVMGLRKIYKADKVSRVSYEVGLDGVRIVIINKKMRT